jgi:Helix-turn-helix domain
MANLHQEDVRPIVRRRELAAQLRRLRGCAQLTEDQLAGRLGWSTSKLSRFEHAHDVRLFPSPQVHSERMACIRRRDAKRRIRRFQRMLVGPPRRSGATADRRVCA